MKKLLLSSKGGYITDGNYDDQVLFGKPRTQVRWAYITTASKSVPDMTYIKKHIQRMQELGWDFETIDIDGKTPDELREILKEKDAVNMLGGNAFYLIKSIRECGFETVLREFMERGGVYCGSSAGAYVACPTIEMATWKVPQKFDHHGVTDFTAMNLVPFLVVVHVTPEIEAMIKQKKERAKLPVKLLTDQNAIIAIDDDIELLEDSKIKSGVYGG